MALGQHRRSSLQEQKGFSERSNFFSLMYHNITKCDAFTSMVFIIGASSFGNHVSDEPSSVRKVIQSSHFVISGKISKKPITKIQNRLTLACKIAQISLFGTISSLSASTQKKQRQTSIRTS